MRIEFNKLPRSTRERLIEVTRRDAKDPVVLARDPHMRTGWFKYVMLVMSGFAVVLIALELLRPRACSEPQYMQETYAMWAAALAICWMAALSVGRRFVVGVPPYTGGRYVFPSGLVELNGGFVAHTPLTAIKEPQLVTVLSNHSYSHTDVKLGHPFDFRFDKGAEAEAAIKAILAARNTGDVPPGDPFASCLKLESWEAPAMDQADGPRDRLPSALFRRLRFPGGVVFGLALAGALYAVCAGSH